MKLQKTKKAFTLIELMIVIAIIGLLAVSLFPQLQGAQERSRDTARLSNMKNVVAVLETFYYEEGVYPTDTDGIDTSVDGNGCLSGSDGSVHPELADLFKGGKAPTDPQKQSVSGDCTVGGSIGYYSMAKDAIFNNSYVLVNDVETDKKANFDWNSISINNDGSTDVVATITNNITDSLDSAAVGKRSVYVEAN